MLRCAGAHRAPWQELDQGARGHVARAIDFPSDTMRVIVSQVRCESLRPGGAAAPSLSRLLAKPQLVAERIGEVEAEAPGLLAEARARVAVLLRQQLFTKIFDPGDTSRSGRK